MRDSIAPGDEAPAERNETVPNTCADCGGSGRRDGGECRTCAASGEVQQVVGGG
jgi:hypothetical protein